MPAYTNTATVEPLKQTLKKTKSELNHWSNIASAAICRLDATIKHMQNFHFAFSGIATLVSLFTMSETIAQQIRSPEVHKNGSVTFRLKSETAKSVKIGITGHDLELTQDDNNIWSVTTEPLRPGIHEYSFDVDGTRIIDPSNRNVKKWFTLASMVEVPGNPPLLTEFQDVDHGIVQRLIYPSKNVGHPRPVVVYTPPGYDPATDTRYPLVVLIHGFGDDETAWTEVGRAHLIADNLIAQGKLKSAIIAMPYGHPIPAPYGERPEDYFIDNNVAYERDLIEDLLPFLENNFKLVADAQNRSIVGLSMGGGHAVHIGLKHTDKFSSIVAFSGAVPQPDKVDLPALYPALYGPDPKANRLKQFWIPIGKDDFLLKRNETLIAIMKEQGVQHKYQVTDGGHSWNVWRKYLPEFLQMVLPGD